MNVTQTVRKVSLIVAAMAVTGVASANFAVAQDGRHVAASILSGIANGLSGQPTGGGFYPGYPQGGVNVQYMNGNNDFIMNSRMQPGANMAIPGSHQIWQNGNAGGVRYLGVDGRWHGNTMINNPNGTQTRVFYRGAPGSTMRPAPQRYGGQQHYRGYR